MLATVCGEEVSAWTSGSATMIGSYGTVAGGKVVSSGDLIGVRGLGIYATVDVGTKTVDYLARIDPTTWHATPIGAGTGFDDIFGLGYWAGAGYLRERSRASQKPRRRACLTSSCSSESIGSAEPWSKRASRSEGIRGLRARTASSHRAGASLATRR